MHSIVVIQWSDEHMLPDGFHCIPSTVAFQVLRFYRRLVSQCICSAFAAPKLRQKAWLNTTREISRSSGSTAPGENSTVPYVLALGDWRFEAPELEQLSYSLDVVADLSRTKMNIKWQQMMQWVSSQKRQTLPPPIPSRETRREVLFAGLLKKSFRGPKRSKKEHVSSTNLALVRTIIPIAETSFKNHQAPLLNLFRVPNEPGEWQGNTVDNRVVVIEYGLLWKISTTPKKWIYWSTMLPPILVERKPRKTEKFSIDFLCRTEQTCSIKDI